jgi:hypothetical protein
MKKQDLVLRRHPDAVLVEVPPMVSSTNSVPLQPGYFVVYGGSRLDAAELGRGANAAAAWAVAASKLERQGEETVLVDAARANLSQ